MAGRDVWRRSPVVGGDCVRRVLRGGSWRDGPDALRTAWRTGHAVGMRFAGNGFRLARTLEVGQ